MSAFIHLITLLSLVRLSFFYASIIFCDIDTSDKNYDISMVSQILIS